MNCLHGATMRATTKSLCLSMSKGDSQSVMEAQVQLLVMNSRLIQGRKQALDHLAQFPKHSWVAFLCVVEESYCS